MLINMEVYEQRRTIGDTSLVLSCGTKYARNINDLLALERFRPTIYLTTRPRLLVYTGGRRRSHLNSRPLPGGRSWRISRFDTLHRTCADFVDPTYASIHALILHMYEF